MPDIDENMREESRKLREKPEEPKPQVTPLQYAMMRAQRAWQLRKYRRKW